MLITVLYSREVGLPCGAFFQLTHCQFDTLSYRDITIAQHSFDFHSHFAPAAFLNQLTNQFPRFYLSLRPTRSPDLRTFWCSPRSADSLVEWLAQYPEVTIVSRDRQGVYSEGARRGAPKAVPEMPMDVAKAFLHYPKHRSRRGQPGQGLAPSRPSSQSRSVRRTLR